MAIGRLAHIEVQGIGRYDRHDQIKDVVTLRLAKEKGAGFKLRIVGGEFDLSKAHLREKINGLGLQEEVELLGELNEKALAKAYATSSAFASASKYEGFGISALEAMAAGLVPVLNDIPAFRRLVDNGKNGFITDFGNRAKAAEATLQAMRLSSAKKARMVGRARALAQRFSWKESIGKFEKLYKGCLVQK